jgi:hypothetical protein
MIRPMSVQAALVAVIVVAVGVLAGCAEQEAPVDHPDGSIRLVANQPQNVGDLRAVVANIDEESAFLSVSGGAGETARSEVAVGDVVEMQGHSFEIIDIVGDPDAAGSDQDGASTAAVWVLVD